MSTPILITVPKYVAISPTPMPTILDTSSDTSSSECSRGKKRRLDHLSWEEKIQRKKLKNRVAAQTSRDRKKAKMDEMENTINILTERTELLQNKCDSLQTINESLLGKNHKLDEQVQSLQQQLDELRNNQKRQLAMSNNIPECSNCVGCGTNETSRSAASSPLLKGLIEPESTQNESRKNNNNNSSKQSPLWKIIALCLLYKTCSKISTQPNWKSLPKVYSQISPQIWKEALNQASAMLPKIQATESDCLDQWWGPQQSSWNPAKIVVTA